MNEEIRSPHVSSQSFPSLAVGKLADDSFTCIYDISTVWRPLVNSHFVTFRLISVVINRTNDIKPL